MGKKIKLKINQEVMKKRKENEKRKWCDQKMVGWCGTHQKRQTQMRKR
jgi:hypothetical protein